MPVAFKAIKPQKLKVPEMYKAIEAEAKAAANDLELEFMLSTATWKHQPKFEKLVQVGPKSVEILVDTDDEIYRYVNEGTGIEGPKHRTYRIPKSGYANLAFPSVFRPKSQPNRQTSGAGYSGGPMAHASVIEHHPGIKPRRFDKVIMKRFNPKFKKRMEDAMKSASEVSGNSMEK
jgi:hypothetical protein